MYDIIKQVIESGRYELNDMLEKIDTIWIQGDITEEQKNELVELTQSKANPENSYAPLQTQIDELYRMVKELTETVNANAKGMSAIKDAVENRGGSVVEPEPEPEEEYPEWYKWNGVGDIPWQDGSKCTHNGKKWISHVNNNIWEPGGPGVYDNIWEKVTDQATLL